MCKVNSSLYTQKLPDSPREVGGQTHWVPNTDVYKTSEGLVVNVELAGLRQEDVEIAVEGNRLLITGQRRDGVRVRGHDCTAEVVALYDCLARLASVALQYGAPLETVGKLLQGVKVEPAGLVTGHPTMHFCSSLPDAIGQHLLSVIPDSSPLTTKD
jgi:hypothetical protein